MSFPKDYHITERDETVSHAVARTLHFEQKTLTRQRKKRKLPKNMDLLKKAKAIAGSDLIMSAGDSKKAFSVAYFGASTCDSGGVGFGLGVDTAIIDGNDRRSLHHTIASVSSHAAARVIGRTVHTADRAMLREAIRPVFSVIAKLWLNNYKQFKELSGEEMAIITKDGAALGRMCGSGLGTQVQIATWVDAHGASGREIPDMCYACATEGLTAIIATRQNGWWVPIE